MSNNQSECYEKKMELDQRRLVAKVRFAQIVEEEYQKYETSFYLLTDREKTVLRYMALGCDSKEIANELIISKHTVDTHRKNIYRKTELKNLRDIILFALIFDMNL